MKHTSFALAFVLSGCGLTPVAVDVHFPSTETFLFSDFGRLILYEVPDDDLGACPQLVDDTVDAVFGDPTLDSDWQPICEFSNGDVKFDDVPPGPHAYVVLARDESNVVLLAGCSIAEAYESAPPVRIDLFPTDAYDGAVEDRVPECANPMTRCTGCQ